MYVSLCSDDEVGHHENDSDASSDVEEEPIANPNHQESSASSQSAASDGEESDSGESDFAAQPHRGDFNLNDPGTGTEMLLKYIWSTCFFPVAFLAHFCCNMDLGIGAVR
jgi:hypothetical protein